MGFSTQNMPQLARTVGASMDPQLLQMWMQALGNCGQPVTHRAGVNVQPGTFGPQKNGVYSGSQWNPTSYQNLLQNVINEGPYIDLPGFTSVWNSVNYGGDQFTFPLSQDFTTNSFFGGPTMNVGGDVAFNNTYSNNVNTTNVNTTTINNSPVPGSPGAQGFAGAAGEPGASGIPGMIGSAGANGFDGLPGPAGFRGQAGRAGTDGAAGLRGPQGPPGPPGKDADLSKLRVTFTLPEYEIGDDCSVSEKGQGTQVSANVEVEPSPKGPTWVVDA